VVVSLVLTALHPIGLDLNYGHSKLSASRIPKLRMGRTAQMVEGL
jgi:hypothetical protein